MTIPDRAFALMRTDRSPFLKGGERNLKPGSLRVPNKDGNHPPRVLAGRPAQKKWGRGGG